MCYYDLVKSVVFAQRNDKKVSSGDKGRVFAEIGQIGNAIAAVSELDNKVGKGTKAAVDAVRKVAETNKALNITHKSVSLARHNVNPLLIGAAAYRVINADDKEKAFKKELFGMGTMFCVESLMKQAFGSDKFVNFLSSIGNSKTRAIVGALQGVVFVIGSILGSNIGYKIGDYVVGGLKTKKSKANSIIKANMKIAKSNKNQPVSNTQVNQNTNIFKSDTPECFQLKTGKMIA